MTVPDSSWQQVSATSGFINRDRADLSLSAKGKFAPGEPIELSVQLRGLRGTTGSKVSVWVSHSETGEMRTRSVHSEIMPIPPRADRTFVREIRFSKPGYYHITALVATVSDEERKDDQSELVPVPPAVTSSAWVLVEEHGGRFDREYDESIRHDPRRYLSNGTIGSFMSRPTGSAGNADADGRVTSAAALTTSPTAFSGRVTYQRYDPITDSLETRGVPGARVHATCVRDDNEVVGYALLTADELGQFTANCPEDETFHVSISTELVTNGVSVRGEANQSAGGGGAFWVDEYSGERVDFPVVNSEAAQVFINHMRYNAGASALFGRSRGTINYRVSNTSSGTARYEVSGDFIRMYTNNVWGRSGVLVAVHEYGHAFHYAAIDPWSTYECSATGTHGPGGAYTTSCAYVEGFAFFFSIRVINAVDGSGMTASDQVNQSSLEINNYRLLSHNRLLDEGAFAGLLLDLVDSPSDDDGISGDDDSISLSLLDLTQIMLMCRMSGPSAYLLSNSDQFVYCAAGSVAERSYVPSGFLAPWGVYTALSFDDAVSLPDSSAFRAAWLYNLYNQ